MYNTKRIELIVKDWILIKIGLELSDETISQMVVDIMEAKQCDIHDVVRSAFIVQDKNTFVVYGLFDSEDKALKYANNSHNINVSKVSID